MFILFWHSPAQFSCSQALSHLLGNRTGPLDWKLEPPFPTTNQLEVTWMGDEYNMSRSNCLSGCLCNVVAKKI